MFKKIQLNTNAYLELYLLDSIYDNGESLPDLPLVLVLPGGGYQYTSKREAQPLALRFNSKFKHAAVLHYTNLEENPDLSIQDLLGEVKQSLKTIKDLASDYSIDTNKIFVLGFSAGGHLATVVNNELPEQIAGVLLGYPAFLDYFDYDPIAGVSEKNKPSFIFTAMDDSVAPASKILDYVEHLLAKGALLELHFYMQGGHGFSLADETTSVSPEQNNPRLSTWLGLANSWIDSLDFDKIEH